MLDLWSRHLAEGHEFHNLQDEAMPFNTSKEKSFEALNNKEGSPKKM
jgi:hypothetical protein